MEKETKGNHRYRELHLSELRNKNYSSIVRKHCGVISEAKCAKRSKKSSRRRYVGFAANSIALQVVSIIEQEALRLT